MAYSETSLPGLFQLQRDHASYLSQTTSKERIEKLKKLDAYLKAHIDDARAATWLDFRKPHFETDLTEIYTLTAEIRYTVKNLARWMRPHRVSTPLSALGTNGYIQYQAKGNTLIIAPWNYPVNLSLKPLISAIAAGCTAIIKPSELTPHASKFVRELVENVFVPEEVCVVEGGVETTQQLLTLPFNHIFFTGSPEIGKIVMKAAAEHLCSVTLELGGKSPAIIDDTINVREVARNLAWAKFINCGQTCIAPDYLFVQDSVKDRLVEEIDRSIKNMFGASPAEQEKAKDYGRIVNQKHFDRLFSALEDAKSKGAKVTTGGGSRRETCYIAPTVVTQVNPDMTLLKEEIFGPILPVYTYNDIDEVIACINQGKPPLALYIHSKSDKTAAKILAGTRSGNALVNEMMTQFGHHEIPFGGVNNSGIGKSNGFYGFQEFSNPKGVIKRRFGRLSFLYPPYTENSNRMIRWMTRYF